MTCKGCYGLGTACGRCGRCNKELASLLSEGKIIQAEHDLGLAWGRSLRNPPETETVNHPSHYGGDTVYETIKVIEAWGLGFNLGNAVKYISRAGRKDKEKTLEDLRKAQFYLNREISNLENSQ